MRHLTFVTLLFLSCNLNAIAQDSRLGIFIDCQMGCDMSYIKQQIPFVDYLQNRQEADIYILATSQTTGAGGRLAQLIFQGNFDFEGMSDTVNYTIDPNSTQAIRRDQMVSALKEGLLKYLVHTDFIKNLEYTISVPTPMAGENEVKDPWNNWVFNVGANGWMNGEASFNKKSMSGRFSANRITDKQKFEFSARYNHERGKFTLTDGEKFNSNLKSYSLYLENVKSFGQHWSLGAVSSSGSSTFGNTDISTSIKGAIEYNVFPYSEAQTKRFSFFYTIGPEYYDYTEATIYEKEKQWVARHGISMRFQQTQKWGELSIRVGAKQYFHDLNLYNAYLNPWFNLQVFKGFSLNFGGSFSFVNDRINIAKSEISDEDILLQIKQRNTSFSYYTQFGINYRFGSKYNNFVNPRF